ncbi:MAG TPA: DUF4139 domain-containing protein [Planctomycetota bacterium]|nr:DUF4139 domain-containing protein [Planctomycetota bacterium]
MKWLAWLLAIAVCVPTVLAAEAAVPVTKVTAFSSGVAYFEHNGKVTGNAEVQLKFKTDGMSDMLKSLVVLDLGGGTAASVNYASSEPLTRALKSFGIDISGAPTLAQLLQQVRGAEVAVAAPEKVTGKILGVESKTRHILPSNTVIEEQILCLLTPEGIKSIPIETIRGIALTNEKLNSELNKALALMVESRDTDSKAVQINFVGDGERPVRVGYITEAPVWKTSYRLILSDEKKDEATLQGWAIVENTSDYDWENVDLTLVSGRPISFVEDLYTPLYLDRPVVQTERYASLRPRTYEDGIEADKDILALQAERQGGGPLADARRAEMRKADQAGRYRANRALAAAPGAPPAAKAMEQLERAASAALQRGVSAVASGQAVGELFSYHIKTPVTLPRRKSAMLPIVNQVVKARKISIYNQGALATNPLNGVWLINSSPSSLLAGPVTVFEAGTYAGDAQIGNFPPGDKRILSYAVDLKVTVDPSASSSRRLVAARIVRGTLTVSHRNEFVQTYAVKNKAEDERAVLIEHPFSNDRKLIEPAEALEKTPQVYRFEVKVPGTKTGKFEVKEERVDTQSIGILPSNIGQLQFYAGSGEIPEKVRTVLAEAIKRKNALTAAERELNEIQQRIQALRREQDDIRKNMAALDRNSQGYQRFEKKLLDSETQIETLQKQLEDKRAGVNKLRADLEDYLGKLNVE